MKAHGVDNLLFDFGVEHQGTLQQAEYLPPELVAAMARMGMGLMLSVTTMPRD